MAKRLSLLIFILLALTAACSPSPTGQMPAVDGPPPTSNPFFGEQDGADGLQPIGADATTAAGLEPLGEELETQATATIDTSNLPTPVVTELKTPPASTPGIATTQPDGPLSTGLSLAGTAYYTVTVYSEELSENWTLDNSQWVTVTQDSETAYQGDYALEWTPYEDFASLFFTVERTDNNVAFDRPYVVGIRFWLSGGETWIEPEDLAITAIGSNQYPYWVPNDYSVQSRIQPIFSETRLQFLGLNQDIPPGEWAPITLLLNELQYDPPYSYVTGFYLKNDRDVLHPLYLDNVELIMVREDTDDES